jgi:hypothetical protein
MFATQFCPPIDQVNPLNAEILLNNIYISSS